MANAALFYNGSAWLPNSTAGVTVPSVGCYGTPGGVLDVENTTGVMSYFHVGTHTYIYVEIVSVNSTVLKMCSSVLPRYSY